MAISRRRTSDGYCMRPQPTAVDRVVACTKRSTGAAQARIENLRLIEPSESKKRRPDRVPALRHEGVLGF